MNALTNNSGVEVQRLSYLPFGETASNQSSKDFDQRRFTGQELDPETGLYNYGARYYNPALGRFISADTLVSDPGKPQALNRYSYVQNNPINLTDPSGHYDTDPGDSDDANDSRGSDTSTGSSISDVRSDPGVEFSDPNPDISYDPATGTASISLTKSADDMPDGLGSCCSSTVSPAPDPLGPGGSSGGIGPGVSLATEPPGLGGPTEGLGPGVGPGAVGGALGPMGPAVGPAVGPLSPPAPPAPFSPALAPKQDPFSRHMRERLMPLAVIPEVLHYVDYPGLIAVAVVGLVTFGVVAPAALGVATIGFAFTAPTVATAATLGFVGAVNVVGALAVGYAGAQVGLSVTRR